MELAEYKKCLEQIPYGKRLPTALYVFWEPGRSFGNGLDGLLQRYAPLSGLAICVLPQRREARRKDKDLPFSPCVAAPVLTVPFSGNGQTIFTVLTLRTFASPSIGAVTTVNV